MDLSTFPIIEFETSYESGYTTSSFDIETGKTGAPVTIPAKWYSKRAIDLRWVATAAPRKLPVDEKHRDLIDATRISMCGDRSSDGSEINIPYEQFMDLWVRAKGIKPA